MTSADLIAGLEMLGRKAREGGMACEIALDECSIVLLASSVRDPGTDVNEVLAGGGDFMRAASLETAHEIGLPEDWMDAVAEVDAPPIGDYPDDNVGVVGVRVLRPVPEYLLAMRLMAGIVGEGRSDMDHVRRLMRRTGIETREALVGLVEVFYPNLPKSGGPQLHPRVETMIERALESRT